MSEEAGTMSNSNSDMDALSNAFGSVALFSSEGDAAPRSTANLPRNTPGRKAKGGKLFSQGSDNARVPFKSLNVPKLLAAKTEPSSADTTMSPHAMAHQALIQSSYVRLHTKTPAHFDQMQSHLNS